MQICISQLQKTVPPMRGRGELEGLQSHIIACLSSTDVVVVVGGGTTKKQGNILAESTISTRFGLS